MWWWCHFAQLNTSVHMMAIKSSRKKRYQINYSTTTTITITTTITTNYWYLYHLSQGIGINDTQPQYTSLLSI